MAVQPCMELIPIKKKRRETSQQKGFCNSNIEKVLILHVLHDNVALLMGKHSEVGTRNCHQKSFRKVWIIYIENGDQKMNFSCDSDEIEIKLSFDILEYIWWFLHSSLLFVSMG